MIGKLFKGIVEGAAAPVAAVLEKREETKQVEASLKSKLDLSDSELQLLRTKKTDNTLRDEIVTVWTLGLVSFLVWMAFMGMSIDDILRVLDNTTVQYLLFGVVAAALGLKGFERFRK